jgi:cytochrome c
MKSIIVSVAVAAGLMVAGSAMADAPKEASVCAACHNTGKSGGAVGPAWKDVAAKYKDDAKAVETLTANIKAGGHFGWKKAVPMPKNGSGPEANVPALAAYIMTLK